MTDSRGYRVLCRVVDVRPEEARDALLLALYFFFITFPAYIIKPVKESLLQASLPPALFPLAPLLTAALIGFVVAGNARLLNRLTRRRYVAATFVFFIVSLIAFRLLFPLGWKGLSIIYWFWSDVFIAVTVSQFWIAVNDTLFPHQAKRLIGFFVGGGLLGGIAGALVSLRLARIIRTENLLLVCPALLVVTLLVADRLYRGRGTVREASRPPAATRAPKAGLTESIRIVRRNRYLRLLAGALASATILSTVIQQQFLTITQAAFPVKDERTAFNAAFLAGLLVFSYLFNLLLTNRILRTSGIRTALVIAPVFLLLGSAAIAVIPAALLLGWSIVVKGADKSLENTLGQSVRELMFIPIPAEIKNRVKFFIDLFVNKLSSGLGALLILFVLNALRAEFRWLSVLGVLFALTWAVLIRMLYAEYMSIVKSGLTRKWRDGDRIVEEQIDADLVRSVFDTLRSRNESSLLYAMNLFDLLRKEKLTPELKAAIACKRDELQAKSIGCLLDAGPEATSLGVDFDPAEGEAPTSLEDLMARDSVKRMLSGLREETAAPEAGDSEVARMEEAKLLGLLDPSPASMRSLKRLLGDPSVAVRTYALESAGRLRREELVADILPQLADARMQTLAADTLAGFGPPIIGTLRDALHDHGRTPGFRRAVPDVLSRIGTQAAADALAGELAHPDAAIEAELIEALYKLKLREPAAAVPRPAVLGSLIAQIRAGYDAVLEPGPPPPDLAIDSPEALISHKLAVRVRKIFELLTLIYPPEDMVKAYQNLYVGTKKAIDYSLEMLDNLLDRDLRTLIFPLIEDLPADERARRCRRLRKKLD